MALKAKKSLSALFRFAMRNAAKTAEAEAKAIAGDSVTSETGLVSLSLVPDLLSSLKSSDDSSITGQDLGEPALAGQVSSALDVKSIGNSLIQERNGDNGFSKNALETSDFLNRKIVSSQKPKQASRGRVQTENYQKKQSEIMEKLAKGCVRKLGTETMFEVLTKMGKEAGEKEYNAMTKLCIERARRSNDAEYALDQIGKAIEHLKEMRQLGFSIGEGAYGPFFKYLVDMEMVEEFQILKDFIKEACPESSGRLVYYEMLLWIQVNDEEKIHILCNTIDDSGLSLSNLQDGVETVSNLIFSYATCIPNSTVEDAIFKFNKLHEELDVVPSSTSYENLVSYLCGSNEVVTALDIVENMCEAGLVISANILHSLLQAVEQILEFNLVQRIYSIMSNKSVKPNSETFRRSINLCIRIKDTLEIKYECAVSHRCNFSQPIGSVQFEGAYTMLGNLKNFNLAPNSSMYNSIMAGYFREKNVNSALKVLKEMKEADVKPDSVTFSYLINYCGEEATIAKYYKEMKKAGVEVNKHVYMSLIKAYASCGQSEKAKQVLVDLEVPAKDHNELKSVLIYALASNGNIIDALSIYEEMKNLGCPVEPKAIISLIDNSDSNAELRTLVELTHELRDYKFWIDGFFKIIVFAVRNNRSSSILDLLEQTKNHLSKDDIAVEYWFEEVFKSIAETESNDVKLGLDLVSFMKEELELCPSRKCLDFLLHACVNAKDKQNALLVWKEYQFAELPRKLSSGERVMYNEFLVIWFHRMYQVLVAAGDSKSAEALVSKIPNDDKDVKCIVKESLKKPGMPILFTVSTAPAQLECPSRSQFKATTISGEVRYITSSWYKPFTKLTLTLLFVFEVVDVVPDKSDGTSGPIIMICTVPKPLSK
ncbi:pentatricopeptide repeat-containing protein [Arabidopsis lyrata subsp. lyrata]|uniref:Pentatricopeptide repeat-containing protein n=1 Tax=Arabidopsis lyrata subsp. lyrata TaxID=81972 RepID=D7MEM9_ARALL|nr:pentatricopeptide repeat-containing protein [Arabidopsis lyrata subsp. lyrata]